MVSFTLPRCRGLILLSPGFAWLDLCLCSRNVNITFSTPKAEQFEFLTCLQLLLKWWKASAEEPGEVCRAYCQSLSGCQPLPSCLHQVRVLSQSPALPPVFLMSTSDEPWGVVDRWLSPLFSEMLIYFKPEHKPPCVCARACTLSCSVMSDSLQPCGLSCQSPLSMEFSRQEYWSRLPIPPPGDLPNSGIEPTSPASPALAGGFFTTEPPGKPRPALGL